MTVLMYFWMGFPWFSHLKLGILMDSPRLSPRFPCVRHAGDKQPPAAPGVQMLCSIVLRGSDLSWHFQIGKCNAMLVCIRVCVCTEGLCMCFCSVQLAMKSHEHIIVIHCLVRTHVCLFRFVRKMIKNVAVAWCDPSLIQQTSCSMNMSMVQSCSII